ncbi:DUF2339 domain-containing protein [Rhodovulum visakhapatnamense]|uniref:DUF2339 domain-containing protein n=2 Tax=Rhodovulum visakhapatnamense TaxID=364297 RepID=A0ABS1RCB3_9RHOB|nr:DUF2339 domain-containing protein [Rhodovulum visakhapatnamense]MBL3577273.1 DUF2339 domain-containing protein [Rhodovulum visakhapatnamense]
MEIMLIVFGGIYGLLVLVGLPALIIAYLGLRTENADLRTRLEQLVKEVEILVREVAALRQDAPQQTPPEQTERSAALSPEPDPGPAPLTAPVARHDEQASPVSAPPQAAPPEPQGPTLADRLAGWLRENWTLALAALSLILGGLFMVQYGVEQGLLTPPLRVLGALVLGAALIAGGEAIRRRHGDTAAPNLRHLPSTFSGAGTVVLFIAILSAHALYGLIGSVPALAGMAVVSVVAMLLGWLYGPVLSAIGLLGATAAPFFVGGSSDKAVLLYPYFAMVGLAGLGIDTFRRWAWVSGLALALPAGALGLLWFHAPDARGLALAALALAAGAVLIPARSLRPGADGPTVTEGLGGARPAFPTWLAAAGLALASGAGLWLVLDALRPTEAAIGFALLLVLFAGAVLGLSRAPAFEDLAILPGGAALLALGLHAAGDGPLYRAFRAGIDRLPESPAPTTVWWLAAGGAALSVIAFQRLRQAEPDGPNHRGFWALGAAVLLPATLLILEVFWAPAEVTGAYPWALAVMAGAALMVLLAERRSALGGEGRAFETGLFAASALILIGLALFLLLTKTALTLALSAMAVAAVAIDRRHPMRPLGWLAQLGAAVIGYRLVFDPGVDWAIDVAGPLDAALAHLGPLAAFAAMRVLARPDRGAVRALADSALVTTAAIAATVALRRWAGPEGFETHWAMGLTATVWTLAVLAQIWRLPHDPGLLRPLRILFAALLSLSALTAGILLLSDLAQLLDPGLASRRVAGPPVFDSLALALWPLALVLAAGARWLGEPGRPGARLLRPGLAGLSAGALGLWGWLEIRRLWRGPELSLPGPSDGELYSYTLALLLASGLGLVAAVLMRSHMLRRLAMAGVGLTVAKVFLIDMSGLSGLVRVASFVGLGLALAGLAWLDRAVSRIWEKG